MCERALAIAPSPKETKLPNSKEGLCLAVEARHLLVVRVEEEYGPDWSLLRLFAADVDRKFGFIFNLEKDKKGICQERLLERENNKEVDAVFSPD